MKNRGASPERSSAAVVFAILGAVLAACGEPPVVLEDSLFLRSSRGVTIVEPGGASPSFSATPALPSPDWSTVVRTIRGAHTTRVVAVDPSSNKQLWSQSALGSLELKAVSRDGDLAVLEPTGSRYRSNPSTTRFVIARLGERRPKSTVLEGNLAPEAFSTDGRSLFVVQYFPAGNPSRYQVRRLDLSTGEVSDVYSVDAELQKSMRGTARIQTMSPDGTRLYTLYTLRSGGNPYAFVHVLSLDELWAHCVDLPAEFARSPEGSTALSVSPDGERLYVANALERMLAEVDTEKLTVVRSASVDFGRSGDAHAAYGSGSTLYLGSGLSVVAVDTSELEPTRSWELDLPVRGLQEGSGDGRLYVAQGRQVAILDPSTGDHLERVDPPGIGAISGLGRAARSVDAVRTEIVCAC